MQHERRRESFGQINLMDYLCYMPELMMRSFPSTSHVRLDVDDNFSIRGRKISFPIDFSFLFRPRHIKGTSVKSAFRDS